MSDHTPTSNGRSKTIVVYSTVWCPDCKRAKKFFGEQRIPYVNVDIEQDPEAMAYVERVNGGMRIVPTIVFPDGSILSEPSNAELADKLGLHTEASRAFYDAIVGGGGPAGLTAALYLSREGIETLVVEEAGLGGQCGDTQMLDNFPGFDEGITGTEFAERLGRQARRFGAEILQAQSVAEIADEDGHYCCVITQGGQQYGAKAVLLATGARYRRLNVPGERGLVGTSIHFCAVCDGPFYKGKRLLVVGGGNSGFEEGLLLTRFASRVDIVEVLPQVKASKVLQDNVARMPDMSVTVNHAIREFRGKHRLESVIVEDLATGEIKKWEYDGVFVFVGLSPNSDLLKGKAETDPYGFVVTDPTLMTAIPGVFAAGDVRAGSTKQAASAAGEGATAALMMRDYIRRVG